jgi:ATP-binding cassette subfamily C (CFTR/MRP) protein 1
MFPLSSSTSPRRSRCKTITTTSLQTPFLIRMGFLFVLTLVVLPRAAPFASGSTAGAASQSMHRSPPRQSQIPATQQTPAAYPTSRQHSVGMAAITSVETKPHSLRDFFRRGGKQPNHNRYDLPSDQSKGGEEKASFASQLFFQYASPLIHKASERRLEAEDSFEISESQKMDHAVSGLASVYRELRTRSKTRQEQKNVDKADHGTESQSLTLTKALLLHQRRNLIVTGLLRLLNTSIQAFPAVLVSRLLKLIEAGDTHAPAKALQAAVTLVAVLSIKMLVENQYFHKVVKCSTQVRGSLAGLIFDKSLRLPGGGSGVTHKDGNGETSALGSGGVLNLMQSDASLIESAALQFHTTWDGPLQIAIYTYLLYQYLGSSVFWGISVLLATIPINSVTLRILNRLAKFENEAKDRRTKRTAESISNMKLLKLQGWEQRFADDIRIHRKEELSRHVSRGIVRAVNTAVSNAVPALVLVVTLTAYAKTGRPIVASTIFTAISLFNQLRFPLFFYPMLIDSLANGKNAMRRISTYLSSEEITPYVNFFPTVDGTGGSIEMTNGNFLWSSTRSIDGNTTSISPALSNVKLKVYPGEVVAVVGTVGSGKSALIRGLLGELNPVPRTIIQEALKSEGQESVGDGVLDRATVITHGNVAYCSQEAWLPKGTLRDAIVFGREYDKDRYRAAIYDAGLDKDIVNDASLADSTEGILSHDTDVGEGGSSLSGGQRARVALARALYAGDDTKVFLLDDCLSALDASVGSMVFERITARLRKTNAATVLVTNDPSLPRRCDRVYLMGKISSFGSCSTIVDNGSYDDLLSRGHNLRSISTVESNFGIDKKIDSQSGSRVHSDAGSAVDNMIAAQPTREERRTHVTGVLEEPTNATDIKQWRHADPECQITMENCPDYIADQSADRTTSGQYQSRDELTDGEREKVFPVFAAKGSIVGPGHFKDTSALADDERPLMSSSVTKLTSADDFMSAGAVPRSTYVAYFKSVRKPILVFAMIASYLMANGAQFYQQYTVAKWTELSHADAMAAALGAKYLRSLVNAAGVVSVFLWFRSVFTMQVGVRASDFFHSRMLSSVFSAPMSFFDATPSGQILSRFGKEIETVDRGVPDSIGSVLFCFLQIFMSIGALSAIITPGMLGPLGIVTYMYIKTMAKFRPAARDMKRAETKTRSPIYTQFGEALRGTETIRSIPGAKQTWSSKHRSLSDQNLGVFYTVKSFDRWLSTRLESLGNTVVFTAAVASVFLTRAGRMEAGSAGWGLTQALAITGLLTWAVRCLTDLETSMMSVMRVKELTDLDRDEVDVPGQTSKRMPVEPSNAGDALMPLLPESVHFNSTLAPLDSNVLLKDGWPWKGNVIFRNVSMKYNPSSPLVLRSVTVAIPAGTTLGVVGRTGSGKSSLLLTLFRLAEIESNGSIEIDGVDIRSVSLETLRSSLAIIPQDPVLFAGSISYNLDASGNAEPSEMWNALKAASPSLARQFMSTGGLESPISEGGKNLSLGQRQLICLARALLRQSKILVLDEATSSVDSKTDQDVQETIRREFVEKGVTVITVAHRLDTVLGYDKIAVLGAGRMLEYGAPNELLQKTSGELRRLVDADRLSKEKGSKQQASTNNKVPAGLM